MAIFRFAILAFTIATIIALHYLQKSPRYSKCFRPFLIGVLFFNGIAGLLAVLAFGTDLPYVDGFGDLRLYGAPFDLSKFTFTTGGHVLAVHPTVYYLIGNATAWNTQVFLVVHWLAFLANAFGIAWLFRQPPLTTTPLAQQKQSHGLLSGYSILSILAIGLAISPSNVKHWMDTRILAHSVTLTLVLLALFTATHRKWWVRNICAPAVCFVATFNLAWGILTWVAFTPLVISRVKRDVAGALIWIVTAVTAILVFRSYFHTGYKTDTVVTFRAIGLGILDFAALNAAFLYPANYVKPYEWMVVPGLALCCLQLIVTIQAWKKLGFWNWLIHPTGILLVYCTLAAHMATVARAEHYPFESQAMRYTSVAIGFSAALLYQIHITDGWVRLKKIVITLVATSLIVSWPYFLHTVHWFYTTQRKAVACLRSEEPFKDFSCYQNTFPDLDLEDGRLSFRRHVEHMRAEKISVYRYLRDQTDSP